MTKEIKTEKKETKREERVEEEPQVFAVQRDLNGWRFSRRDFLAAASAAAAAIVAGKTAGCTSPKAVATPTPVSPTSTSTPVPTDTFTPVPTHTPTHTPTPTPTPTGTPTPTSTAMPTKTPTPTKTPLPTKTATPTPTDTLVIPLAQFIEDVTIPDGTAMEPGQAFTKTWRLKNVGAVEWGEGSSLSFHDGEQMGGASPVAVSNVQPGETVDISVDMVAPVEAGDYIGRWRLFAADGIRLMTLSVVISVVPPGEPGEVPAGQTGINFTGPTGETRTMPCGSPIPPGWTCTCNCVTVPPACGCVGHCSCDRVSSHYWYPC